MVGKKAIKILKKKSRLNYAFGPQLMISLILVPQKFVS